ncbi:PAS domain S-box protein [Glaciimonas sp. PAMC28666]|uniref:PAS domain S-box protein n=1 Tax=Glaciimonas sp. PAMC28666 TaxID=2807626 RepID=UPI0019629E2B|nr:PAS domain S-box protein [Glaciimonas sp. PAMC28666]QRX81701.1 PAS domain S-box protein [Glaciimonas sp. PAMC28666]
MHPEFDFLSHGGEMGALMRERDWTSTPLGAPSQWPEILKITLRLVLTSKHPMFIWWGKDLFQFYNDSYRRTMGPERHATALGQSGHACWAEIWHIIGPQIDFVMAGGGATWHESQLVPVTRHGAREDVWWTYGYSPIEDSGGVQGVLVVCNDVTDEHVAKAQLLRLNLELAAQMRRRDQAEERQTFQLGLADRLRGLTAADDIARTATELLGKYLQVSHVYYTKIDAQGGTFHISYEWKLDHLTSLVGAEGELAGFGPEISATLSRGQPFAVSEIRRDPRTAAYIQAYDSLGANAILVIPVIKAGQWVAALTLYLTLPYDWTPGQIALVENVAERLWNAVERADQVLRVQRAGESERLHTLFRQAPGFIQILRGPQHVFEFVNAAYVRLVGERELLGKPIREVFPELEGQGLSEMLDQVFTSGMPFFASDTPVVLQRQPDAPTSQLYVDLVCQPMVDAEGSVSGIFVQGVDVTERRLAQLALHASEEHFRGAFENASLGMTIADMDGRWIKVNRSFCAMLGYTESELLSKISLDLTHPDDVQITVAQTTQLRSGKLNHFHLEKRYIHRDGHSVWVILSLTLLHDAQGTALQYVGTIEDISERKQSQAEQTRLNRALRLLSDCNSILVRATDEYDLLNDLCRLVVESGGYLMGWVGIAEQDAAKTVRPIAQSGYEDAYLDGLKISWDGEQVIGRGPTGTAIRTGFTQVTQNCLTNPVMAPWREAVLKRKYHTSVALALVLENQVLGALTLYSAEPMSFSLNEVQLLEELASNMAYGMQSLRARSELARYQLRLEERVAQRTHEIAALNAELVEKANDAEAANLAKSTFVATMSHEIRTPLNAVVGLTGLLADSALDRLQRDYADKLLLSAQALRRLVDDILDFSKIEAGALRLERAPFSLNAILSTTAALMSIGLRGKSVEALFDVAQDMPDALIGDGMRLQQILLNLTSNAVKFTEQGEIVVSVRCLERQAARVTLEFSVRDTGIGIRAEQLGQIFNVFTQADPSTTRLYGGTGLGLAIIARLAGLMDSQIQVDSVPGRGSDFVFAVTLALAESGPTVVPQNSRSAPALSVLIVNDHPLARDILQRTCAGFGWQASAFDSGAAGLNELRLSAAEDRDYDLMLLDWRMPGMDGAEMLRQAYDAPDIGLPQVILMASVFELGQAAAASDDLYLDGIIAIPITPASLFDAVTRAQSGDFSAILPLPDRMDGRLSTMRLLVVEDNAINQQVIEQILIRAGAEVVIASGALAAFDALRAPFAHFDAVLMDIQMPGMDGHVAARIIRQEMGWIDLPIIAVTAYALPEDYEKSQLAGMTGHIVKPIDVEDLLDILTGRRHSSPSQPDTRRGTTWKPAASTIHFAGVDGAAALKSFGCDEKTYAGLLRQFVVDHGGDVDVARRLFNAGDSQGSARLIHGLRGMASMLQATDVARLTAVISSTFRGGQVEAMSSLIDELQVAMQILVESIAQFDAVGSALKTA